MALLIQIWEFVSIPLVKHAYAENRKSMCFLQRQMHEHMIAGMGGCKVIDGLVGDILAASPSAGTPTLWIDICVV